MSIAINGPIVGVEKGSFLLYRFHLLIKAI